MKKIKIKKKSSNSKNSDATKVMTKIPNTKAKPKNKTKVTKQDKKSIAIISILLLAILVAFYFFAGLLFTVLTAVGLFLIIGLAYLLKKVEKNKKKKKLVNRIIIIILILGIIGVISVAAFFGYIVLDAQGKYDVKKLNTKEVSILYDINGNEYAKLGSEMREKVTYDEIPEVLIDAIIATEDARFFQHNGLDVPRFTAAVIGQVTGQDAGGGSTLSMQVIKNSMTSTEASGIEGVIRKFSDVYLAMFNLEKDFSKEEIIEYYVNNHFLGGNIYGVQEASIAYFGKNVQDLTLAEASIIAGMFQSPNLYRPDINPEEAEERRSTVLYLMERHGYITEEEEALANSIPVSSLTTGNSNISSNVYQGYIDTVVDEIDEKYNLNPYVTPLEIHTNLDPTKQDAVNSVMNGESYTWVDDKVQAGVTVLDSDTGKLLAVGTGRNREGLNSYNYATQIKRQPGSTAKPLFDYGPGIEYLNWSTGESFIDEPYSYSNGQSIRNWDNKYYGAMTLRTALATSRNITALKAFQMNDNEQIIEFVTNLGIQPEIENGKIHEAHSLGAFTGTNPLEMSAAYAAFANGGYYNEPYSVSKIVNRETGEVHEHESEQVQAMSDATAFMIADVLADIQMIGGTPSNVSAKTGTTNYDSDTISKYGLPSDAIRDSWVVGFTPDTVVAMWYGYDFIDSEYVLRNIPASTEKDKLYRAFVNAGAFEANRSLFTAPSSVVKIGNEYYKVGFEPEEIIPLATPTNLKATLSGNKVSISWNGVSRVENDEDYGEFGYNVYKNGTLLGFTTSTTYTHTDSSPYATYKVVATYKSFSEVQSGEATYVLKEDKEEEPEETLSLTLSCDPATATGQYIVTNNSCIIKNGSTTITGFTYTSDLTIEGSKNIDSTGIYTITGSGTYQGKNYELSGKINITIS